MNSGQREEATRFSTAKGESNGSGVGNAVEGGGGHGSEPREGVKRPFPGLRTDFPIETTTENGRFGRGTLG